MAGGTVSVLGSMATRALLAELAPGWDGRVAVESAGGVDVARRVRNGEAVDLVVLAGSVMKALEAEGVVVPGSLAGIASSGVAVAVREGTPLPDLEDEAAVRRAVVAAERVGYSTGASGEHLLRLLDGWGLREAMEPRLVRAPPGVPVGRLLADGQVDLGMQQRSELLGLPGITIAGPLPPPIQAETVFTAGIARTATAPDEARRFVAFLLSPATADAKRRHGLEPA